ncbi:MAG: M43 family zinc metalloprotease [Phycisphaerae bacterium]
MPSYRHVLDKDRLSIASSLAAFVVVLTLTAATGRAEIMVPVAQDVSSFSIQSDGAHPPATITYRRAGESSDAVQAGGSELVYSNTGGDLFFPPGADRALGDDIRTLAGCGCTLDRVELPVGGGGDGTGAPFSMTVGLYNECPEDGGTLLPGSMGTVNFPDDGDYILTLQPSAVVALPRRLWIVVEPDRANAGWYSGSSADPNLGVTSNVYYLESFSCTSEFPVTSYAGFNAQVYCLTDGGPGPVHSPFPPDGGNSNNLLGTVLSWNSPGTAIQAKNNGPIGDEVGSSSDGDGDAPVVQLGDDWVDPAWINESPDGHACLTQQHYDAKMAARGLGGGQGGVAAGGPCSLGVCDNPTFRDSFIPDAGTPVNIYRLHFHIFCNDSGGGCTSTPSEVVQQANTINANFAPYRIAFEYEISTHNSTQYRDYTGSEEFGLKTTYAVDPDEVLNMFIVNTSGFSFGVFPWDPDALTALGGVVQGNGQFSATSSTPTHEIGHNLGLWHTHHGVSEVNQCSTCYEEANNPSSVVGDRCADTAPTPTNFSCGNPGGSDPCSGNAWNPTDFTNFMSYSSCRDEFSPQQAGRMHCWTEDVLSNWLLAQCGTTYDVYFDTIDPPFQLLCDDTPDVACEVGPLECGTTYYWRVDVTSTDNSGTTTGEVWSFTTPSGPDCNNNGEADACDILYGGFDDCNANGQPDVCEDDCQSNNVADSCDISNGTSADCDNNSIPDECEADADADGNIDACDICAGGDDFADADADGVPDFCDICPGGNDNTDFDADGVPNFCDPCPNSNPDDPDKDGICTENDNCAEFNPDQTDCQNNDVGDVCDINGGGSLDANNNGVPDECEIATPYAEDGMQIACKSDAECANEATCIGGTCYVPKNRYLSIDANPQNAGQLTARRVQLDGVTLGWMSQPDFNNVTRVVNFPAFVDWSALDTVHLGDCHISPGHTYSIQAINDGTDLGNEDNYSTPLVLPTCVRMGDVGGAVDAGTLLPPDGDANFNDIFAVVLGFQGQPQAPVTSLDLEGETPNFGIGLADAQIAVFGFQSQPYPFSDPCSCAGLAPCP